MRFRQTNLYAAGIMIAAFAALAAVSPPPAARNTIDWAPPPFISGSQLPAMMNSADTKCGNQRQCSEYEFEAVVSDLQRQWAITPEWVRNECAGNATVPSMEHCIVERTQAWLRKNSNRQAPWVKPDTLGTVAQYAALSSATQAR